jgi:hypothetical protein
MNEAWRFNARGYGTTTALLHELRPTSAGLPEGSPKRLCSRLGAMSGQHTRPVRGLPCRRKQSPWPGGKGGLCKGERYG